MDDKAQIVLTALERTAHDTVLRNVVSEMEHCCTRAEARSKLVDVFLDLIDVRLAVLSLVSLKIIEKHKVGSLIFVKATAYALARRVSLGHNFIVGDKFR